MVSRRVFLEEIYCIHRNQNQNHKTQVFKRISTTNCPSVVSVPLLILCFRCCCGSCRRTTLCIFFSLFALLLCRCLVSVYVMSCSFSPRTTTTVITTATTTYSFIILPLSDHPFCLSHTLWSRWNTSLFSLFSFIITMDITCSPTLPDCAVEWYPDEPV